MVTHHRATELPALGYEITQWQFSVTCHPSDPTQVNAPRLNPDVSPLWRNLPL